MSFISRGDVVFRRLIERLDLKTLDREPVQVPSTIQPVTIVDELLDELQPIGETTGSATNRTDVYTVPDGKMALVHGYNVSRANTAGLDVLIGDKWGGSLLINREATATEHWYLLPEALRLDAGWFVSIQAGFNASSGTITSRLMYRLVDAY